jgi:hypothetical protein
MDPVLNKVIRLAPLLGEQPPAFEPGRQSIFDGAERRSDLTGTAPRAGSGYFPADHVCSSGNLAMSFKT